MPRGNDIYPRAVGSPDLALRPPGAAMAEPDVTSKDVSVHAINVYGGS